MIKYGEWVSLTYRDKQSFPMFFVCRSIRKWEDKGTEFLVSSYGSIIIYSPFMFKGCGIEWLWYTHG